jgi:hypothetical protein
VIKLRAGKGDVGHAHRGQIETADRDPLTPGRPLTAKIAISSPTIAQMRNEPQVRASALLTTRARPFEADGVGELLPVYGVQPAVLRAEWHGNSMSQLALEQKQNSRAMLRKPPRTS